MSTLDPIALRTLAEKALTAWESPMREVSPVALANLVPDLARAVLALLEDAERGRPRFCPNCASPLPVGAHGAQPFAAGEGDDAPEGWDCFCDACRWSGDIMPDVKAP